MHYAATHVHMANKTGHYFLNRAMRGYFFFQLSITTK